MDGAGMADFLDAFADDPVGEEEGGADSKEEEEEDVGMGAADMADFLDAFADDPADEAGTEQLAEQAGPAEQGAEPAAGSTADTLTRKLKRRPSAVEARQAGVLKSDSRVDECPSITAKKQKVAHKLVGRRLSALLDKQPELDDLHRARILQPQGGRRMSARLQSVSRTLQRKMSSTRLNDTLTSRPNIDELQQQNVVKDSVVAPPLSSVSAQLQHNMRSDSVKSLLQDRPLPQDVSQWMGLDQAQVGRTDNITVQAYRLDKKLKKSQVHRRLSATSRPNVEDLQRSGILLQDEEGAFDLPTRRKSLQHQMTKDQLAYLLKSRPHAEKVESQNIMQGSKVARQLQVPRASLDKKLRRASLNHSLGRRPSLVEMQSRGLLDGAEITDVDSSMGDAMSHTESQDGLNPRSSGVYFSMHTHDSRKRFGVAFTAVGKLVHQARIDQSGRAVLKELILDDDPRVFGAVDNFLADQDFDKLMDALQVRLL